ncbi:MAG: T9SS type A sorting domain-containing protein [Bacteroidetes bacterium]|nr:T9SS type A sorting domain-containing protein [Bacteroidota bacterium]
MKKLFTIIVLLLAFSVNAQTLQRIQEEANPVYIEKQDNSELGRLWREMIAAKTANDIEKFTRLLGEIKAKYPEKVTPSNSQNSILKADGPTNPAPFQNDWGNYNFRVFTGNIAAGGTNTSAGENPRTLRIKSDSAGNRYCAFIRSTRDTLYVFKSTNNGSTWTSLQRFTAQGLFFHSFDFYTADSANVIKLGFAASLTTSASGVDGQLFMGFLNSDGSGVRTVQVTSTPSGRGLINPAIMTDASQTPTQTTAWYITYSDYSPSTPAANAAMAAMSLDWGATFTTAIARNTFNDYDLDIDYIRFPTGDTLYVVLANNLTTTNPNLRIRRVPVANFVGGTWTQVNPANSANPEFFSQLTVNRLTGQMICTFVATVGGTTTAYYNYNIPGGASFNTTNYYSFPTEAAGSTLPMCDANPWDSTFRVAYLTPTGVIYNSSKNVVAGFTRNPDNLNYGAAPSTNIAPDVTGFRRLGNYYGAIVYNATGNANINYNGEDLVMVGVGNNSQLADGYSLSQNYPNPFNPSTSIKFNVPVSGFTSLKVYDILGNEVATLVNQNVQQGEYSVQFNTSELNLSSGVYFYKLTSGNFTDVKKMSLIK